MIIKQNEWSFFFSYVEEENWRAQCQYLFSSFFFLLLVNITITYVQIFSQSTVRWESKQIEGMQTNTYIHTYTSQVSIFTGIYKFDLHFRLIFFLLYRLVVFVSIVLDTSKKAFVFPVCEAVSNGKVIWSTRNDDWSHALYIEMKICLASTCW